MLLVFIFISGYLAYSSIDSTVYTSEQLVVVPGVVEADGWGSLDSVLMTDLSGEALYQDFNTNNSAAVITESPAPEENQSTPTDTPTDNPTDVTGGSDSPESEGNGADDTTIPEDSSEPVPSTPEPEESPDTASSPEPESEPTPAPSEPVSQLVPEPSFTVVTTTERYPWAQFSETVEIPAVTDGVTESVDEPTVSEETIPAEAVDTTDDAVEAGEAVTENPNDESTAPSDDSGVISEPGTPEELLVTEEVLEEETTEVFSGLPPCLTEEGCTTKSMTFRGFELPEFEPGTMLENAQLRLSLAAQTKDQSALQRFVVSYSVDNGLTWQAGTVIDIEDEQSNSINGDYYLISLDVPPATKNLSELQVKLTYEGVLEKLEGAYLDGIWLEVTSGTFYEAGSTASSSDAIEYDRDLEAPKFHTLHNDAYDVTSAELPSFTMSYDPQQGFLRRIFNTLFSENEYAVGRVELRDGNGELVSLPYQVTYSDDTTWTVQFTGKPQKMLSGKYEVRLVVEENDIEVIDTFEFYWGVLAVNTKKTMYSKDEEVTFNLAALTDRGDTICNADLGLRVISPSNVITDVPVAESGFCGKNNVTDMPDYEAVFADTDEYGKYSIQLEHRNVDGEVVHKIADSFEVREYIPYDITRTAPTRIYPPSPYTVTLDIKANRSFTGDIVERVPRGFTFADTSGAVVTTLTDATVLTWEDVSMEEGETLQLSYVFDAPDISPYMYLLGPLDMDGFTELRQWQIASDAISSVAWLTATRTQLGTDLNDPSAAALLWGTSTVDSFYFNHSTSSTPERLFIERAGDYLVSVTLPLERNDTNGNWTRVGFEVRVNGVVIPHAIGRSGLISNILSTNRHNQSSGHGNFLLTDLQPGDYIEVYTQALTSVTAARPITITGEASLFVEHIPQSFGVFAGTGTRTVASTSFNTVTSEVQWVETRQDSGFLHSDTVSPEDIVITDPGTYMVFVNMPFESYGAVNPYRNVLGRVLLDGAQVPGGVFSQGTIIVTVDSDNEATSHWSGMVVTATSSQVLSISMEQEAAAGTTTVPTGFEGSIYIQKLPSDDVIAVRGRTLTGGTNWNVDPAQSIQWDTQLAYDSGTFSHSTSTNSHQITINEGGDYLLAFNDALFSTAGTNNVITNVLVNGNPVVGAQTKTHYISNGGGQLDSSGSLVYNLEGLSPADIVSLTVLRDANTTVVDDRTDAMLMMWKKKEFNFRPGPATMFNTPFDNVRFASTTPFFEFSTTDPDGASELVYQFEIATTSSFANPIVRTSDTDPGYLNTASTSDVSPFVEGNRVRYQLQSGDALTPGVYYWRVRAKDVTGSDEFGDWSTTQSLTIDTNQAVASWYQTTGPQFLTNVLTGVASVDGDGAVVDIAENTEAILVYGEKTDTLLKYRFINSATTSSEINGPSVGAEIFWAESAAGITRDEYVAVTLTADGDTNALVYSASTSVWSSPFELVTDVNTPARRGIGVTYETISGDAMVVTCSATGNPVYSIWNGSTWSATTTISVASASNCNWIRLASDPTSDEIIMLIKGAADTYQALVWNGSTWGNSKTLGRVAGTNLATDGMSVVYSESGDLAMFVSTDAGDNEFMYTTWDGTNWSANVNYPLPNDFEVGQLVSDVGTDRIGFCLVDAGADIHAGIWDGTVWGTFTILEPATESTQSRPVDCEFETFAGRDGYFSVAYSDANTDEYQFFDGTSWSGPLNLTDMEEFWYLQMLRTGDGTLIAAGMENAGADPLRVSRFNGSTWSANTLIEADPSETGADPRSESFTMSARRFSFAQGIVRTNPITFSAVPGRTTWGDVSFTTTEPIGTNVSVRLKYTATTTCDTYIPNGALAGNGSGFTNTSSPINISGLSTTTYSQICLEATISRTGSVSASLDDWEVTWVRQPKLIQRAYRWYTNGSFYTPTDVWPLGVFDVAENTPISATEAISINEAIRLRIAAEGLNISLATDTAAFKLQYAEGLTCSPTLAWQDVGAVGSTTAVWRGFANAVIATDWYNAAWTRRIKITVDHTLVDADLTNFPVYVNLDDLPAVFFDNVQSDGDDIRVTNVDGITELPYELVSINTTTDKGELHFRANLASTTNSEFYIYYGNASASGYAATAPFGRNNVWSNNFYSVYHLDTNPTSAMVDSTGNGRTLTGQVGIAATNSTSTLIGNGIFFDGNDRLTNAGLVWPNTNNPVTVTAWNNVTTAEVQNSNLFGFTAVGNERLATHAPWADNTIYWDYGTCCAAPGRVNIDYTTFRNKWTHIGLVSQGGSGAFMGLYLDGILRTSIASSDDPNVDLTGFSLGSDNPTGGNHHRGRIDEFRIATVARSGTWLSTEENNQSNATGFYAVSAEEIVNDNRPLPSTLLTGSDYAETYEQENPTRRNINTIAVGNQAEWDFVLQNNAGAASTNYCFRLVYENGALLSSYDEYPRLITNAPPLRAENSAPFANEQFASTTPWLEFAAADELDDEVSYVVEVSTDALFGSVLFSRDSNPDFSLFTNLSNVSQRSLYTPGQTIRFIPDVALSNNTTYWWRVRAKDDNGSGASGEWSIPTSFTVNTGTTITTWFQTTEEQFATNELLDAVVTTSDDIRIAGGFTAATTTSTEIRFADVDTGNAWGELLFTDNESSGDIKYSIEYLVSGSEWALVPDTVLPGNAAGFDTSGVSLLNLDIDIYHTLRIRALLTGNSTLPRLESWSITWGLRIEPPIHADPFDNAKVDSLTPELLFTTSDPQNDALQYELEIDTDATFASPTTVLSGIDAGFVNNVTPADTSPFNSGETITYTIQSALTNGTTYWWRVRARDPLPGEDAYSDWSTPTSFTVDLTLDVSTWFQTTGEQFATNDLSTIQTTAGTAEVTTIVNGAMTVYGESTTLTPRYRLWSGSEWSDPQSALTVGAFIEWTVLQAAPLRNEYALATLGTDGDVNLQIFNAGLGTWGNLFEIQTEIANTNLRAVDIAYETNSGDLIAVSCDGQDAVFSTWNGTSWSATTSIALTKAANCEYIKLASDPTSDELIAVFRNGTAGTPDYEVLVWNGASWGNAVQFGDMDEAANEGIAVEYEASGNQAVVVVSNGANANFLYNTWNGSSWSGTLTNTMQDDFEHAVLKRDVGTDRLALCNIDEDGQISNVFWNGAAWDSRVLLEATGNSKAGRPVSCEFETTPGREGYLMIPYSDLADVRYQFYATSTYSGELPLGTFTDAWTTQTIRTADGLIMMMSLRDEGVAPADRYEFSYWDGTSWQGDTTLSGVPSVTGIPFHESIAMAAQIFPNFTEGTVRSTPIRFADGDGPRWQSIDWNDTTPGASTIRYRVYYESAPGVFTIVPNSAIPGNAAGFTTGPINISSLDTSIYATLQLEADLQCALGDCPALEDWQVEWSEGIIVSGLAFEYDQTTPMATGTVAIAVNGVLQVGKTAPVSSGFITQKAVFDTTGTTTFAVPSGVTELTVKAWGAGGAGGAGGARVPGASGGGGGFVGGTIAVTPAENLTVRIGGAGSGGVTGSPAGGGGGGGYTAMYRASTPLLVAGGGGGGGAGAGGISYVGVGTACLANNTTCTPTVPGSLAVDDVLIAVVKSRTDTAHTCTTNCAGWTEFSVQAGGANGRLSVWYYRATSTSPTNPTFAGPATDSYTARIWAFRGVTTTGDPFDVRGTNQNQAANTLFTGSGITTTVPNAMPIFVGGAMDDNTWGPAGGVCTVPGGVVADFYASNINGNDNSIFLCYDGTPTSVAGPQSVPTMTQATLGADAGRHFTFALRPATSTVTSAGAGGVGGGVTGGSGLASGASNGGGAGTASAGGAAGSGLATAGGSLFGGNGGTGTGGGAGGIGGTFGGGTGGTGDAATARAGGGAGGAGYFGGGGGAEAASTTVSGAGGGGGSSFVIATATATSTVSGSSGTAGNTSDPDYISGIGAGGSGGAQNTNGANGGGGLVVLSWTATTTVGAWSISNVNAEVGDVITVFINGATSSQRTVGVTKYDGAGDVTGMELNARHLTIGSNDNSTTTNVDIGRYDGVDDTDLFYTVNGANELTLCGVGVCGDARLKVKAGSTYQPLTNGTIINLQNFGRLVLGTSTLRVAGAWQQLGTFVTDTSTVIFTSTSTPYTLQNATSTFVFHNVTFGETSGTATWTIDKPLSITGSLGVVHGTLARGTSTFAIGGNLTLGANGFVTGMATTTFNGSGSNTWSDAKVSASSTNVGNVVIDGTAKTITLAGNVGAQSVTIGADDTLNASGSGFNINVVRAWTNNNLFVPQTGTVTFVGTSTGVIVRGTSPFNNLSFTGVGGNWSFSTSTLALNGTLTIATGTVTLPTGTTTIAGSFNNTGGTFLHNNGEVRMTSTVGGRTITQRADVFNNAFYDLVFTGSGAWSYTESAATTTRNMLIQAGTVTFASSTLTVGGDFSVTGSGAFAHNNGELVLLVTQTNALRTNGSVLNNVRTRGIGSGSWYNSSWGKRLSVTVQSSQVPTNLTNFPVYVNLANLPVEFFSSVKADGGDIRVTTADGITEVPVEIVSLNTGARTGELHFRASALSSTTNSVFYVYYNNPGAATNTATSTFGRANVWSNGYEAVYHLQTDPSATMIDSTVNARNLTQVGGMNSSDVVAGAVGNGIDFDGVDDRLTNAGFAWPNASNTVTVTAWNNVTTAETKAANLFGFNENAGQRFATHGPWNDAVLYWDFGTAGVPGRVQTAYNTYRDKWTHVALTSPGNGGGNMNIYLDGTFIAGSTASDPSATLTGFFLGSLGAAQYHDGRIDEFRIASVVRTAGWIATEENNQASSTAFYTVSGEETQRIRTFADTNTTILGNVVLENGGDAIFPTGTLFVGGSFDNNANFNANNGVVRFNSTGGSETIAAGSSTFATLEFNATSGVFAITEHATATVALNLVNASAFTLNSGLALTASGTFSQAMSGTSTTWTGSTLRLLGADQTIHAKTFGGDVYGTLETGGDTDIAMWNSSATSYITGSTASIYSQDHAGVDGDLNIYGNYVRTTGTEHWSWGTDFDGVALGGGSRQVDVRVATGSTVGFVNASWSVLGTTSATTTVAGITGNFDLSATNTTITGQFFSVANTGVSGLRLLASSTISALDDGFFTVTPGQSGITIDGTTVSTNPAKQFNRIGFATTTPGTGANVTFTGTSTSFVWFRNGSGNLYGEAFDAGDLNPGAVRFDDSSYLITVSGRILANNGSLVQGAPVCNGTTPNVRIVVNNGSYTASTSCNGTTGAYSFTNVAFVGDPVISVYLNTNGGVQGSVVTKTPTANITNLDLYTNQVMMRHEGAVPMTIADLVQFNNASDTDMGFVATTTPSTSLTVTPARGLFIWASSTFTPGGPVTLTGNASSSAFEGTLTLATSSRFVAEGTQTHTLSGRLLLGTSASITPASSTFAFVATTTGKSITGPSTINLHNVTFTGVGGAWNITAPLTFTGDVTVATGTVTGTNNLTLQNGQLTGNGTLSLGSGTTTIARTNTLGGTTAWTFANLVLGDGVNVGTTTRAATATTTISGRLTIANGHTLAAGSEGYDFTGSGTVFQVTGTWQSGTSLVRYSGANASVLGATYYDLAIGALTGSSTFTGTGSGILVGRNLTVGNGTASSTFNMTTSDPVLTVLGDVLIQSSSTLSASDIATTTMTGSYDNNGRFFGNGGLVTFTGSGSHTIAAGSSSFSRVTINGTGSFTLPESATTTVSLILQNHTLFTVATGTTLAVAGAFENRLGGSATVWSGALFAHGGGSIAINQKTTSDVYSTLRVASGTRVRMWNSTSTIYDAQGGIYSQDHAGTDGSLRIFGNFNETSAADHWSFATDFDGTALGTSTRPVTVAFASSTTATWSGGSLSVIGSTSASTTLQNQGVGTYQLILAGSSTVNFNRVVIRDVAASGITLTGTPTVTDFSRTDHLIRINSGTGLTVGGTVINANEAKNFTNNIFAPDTGVIGATNVTATGTAISSWRFTNHVGGIAGEAFDVDPAGDPGYLVWDDSAALVTVSGNVYSDEGVTVSPVCDGVTNNIVLRVAGLTTYSTSCNAVTGAYSIGGVAYSPLDSLIVYIDGATPKGAHVTKSPISSISNLHIYHNRVIVRHENTDPITIADMAVWDSSDDADIPFTAVDAGSDTLTLPADRKLMIWTGKTFAPAGSVTLSGGGVGDAVDGSFEALANARFRGASGESHSIGGNFIFGTGAVLEAGLSTTTFTSTVGGRTIDVNAGAFNNVAFTGSGSWTVTDATFTTNRSFTQSAGTVTFGSGTTTIGASFNATGGSFSMTGPALIFTSTSTGNTVRFDDSTVPTTTFSGAAGAWAMTDTNATTTGGFFVTQTGSVTLPSGALAVGGSFDNASGTIIHNTADIIMTGTGTQVLRAAGSDLFAVRKTGTANLTMLDGSLTLRDDLTIGAGSVTLATNTLAIAGSMVVTGGTFSNATGTVLFNATTVGKTIQASTSNFYNVNFGSASGGWTWLGNATTTNNVTLTTANSFTKEAGTTLAVGGVFTNLVGGAPTTWTNTVLRLTNSAPYTINTKTSGGDAYATLDITSADLRTWNSSVSTTTVGAGASLYSQDNAAVDGQLFIYGDFTIATTTEHWSFATDFDGTALVGPAQRAVQVSFANGATTTVTSGTLNLLGSASASTTIGIIATGTHSMRVEGGTFNAQFYRFNALNSAGLTLANIPTVTNLSNGYYDLAVNGGTLITLNATALNANASKIFSSVGFNATTGFSGVNVALVGSTTNAWRFSGSYGTIGGEAFDNDGIDACGSIRFDNSACLLTSQTTFRWRNDDGLEGAPDSEWFDASFDYRQRVRVQNTTGTSFGTTTLKIVVPYDSSMQSDFDDIRFTLSNGVSPTDYWRERFTASTEATFWVEVPSFAAAGFTTVFMYYGSSTALSTSNASASFVFADDFEDNNITEYSGDTSLFQTDTAPVFAGTYALEASNKTGRTTDGIYRTGSLVAQGQVIRYMQYVDTTSGSADEGCVLFGVQGNQNQNYGVCLELFGTDRISLSRDVDDNDVSGTVLASTTITYTTGWYEVQVDWQTNNRMDVYLYNPSGALVATTSATDSNYTSGGVGYTFWIQNGAWDSYTARGRAPVTPPVIFGAEQTDGGATWLAAQNAAGSGLPGTTRRLRIGIENSGLTVSGQTYRLQYAPKGVAPTCEAVSSGSYTAVPNQASCGSSPVCMQTSTNITDGGATTDLLSNMVGTFSAGQTVESPSNVTGGLTLNQNFYTELEYVITPTVNASDAYCFRVVNNATPLDFYAEVAELGLQFDPSFGPVTLNNGQPIVLIPNATTSVFATGTVTDFNGFADLVRGTSTIYRSGAGAGCAADNNNCYVSTTGNGCSFINCTGNTCTLSCRADIYFHADPTDAGTYSGQEWLAYLEVNDTGGAYDFASALGVELLTLRALGVDTGINYGSLAPSDNTGDYNATTTIANIGNVPFDIEVVGTNLTDGGSSVIPADRQKFATSTFTYAACATCSLLSSSTPVELAVNLPKPSVPTPPVTTPIYWGIEVPFGVNSAPHSGINVFTPVTP